MQGEIGLQTLKNELAKSLWGAIRVETRRERRSYINNADVQKGNIPPLLTAKKADGRFFMHKSALFGLENAYGQMSPALAAPKSSPSRPPCAACVRSMSRADANPLKRLRERKRAPQRKAAEPLFALSDVRECVTRQRPRWPRPQRRPPRREPPPQEPQRPSWQPRQRTSQRAWPSRRP